MGIGIVTEYTASRHDDIVPLSERPWGHMGLWILTHRNLRYAPRVRAFMQFMGQYPLAP